VPSISAAPAQSADEANRMIDRDVQENLINKMADEFGSAHRQRIEEGVRRVGDLWRAEDGSVEEFEQFCSTYFISREEDLDRTYQRLERNYEALRGHLHQIRRTLSEPLDLDIGPPLAIDYLFAKYSPTAHLNEDFFRNKIAFVIALNFPFYSLQEKLVEGPQWSRGKWARVRVGELYTARVPAEVLQRRSAIYVEADNYINEYNIHMDRLLTDERQPLFPADLKLISHWGLRDELKAQYARPDGLGRQEMIYQVMLRIIDQSIPDLVINNERHYWQPFSNQVLEAVAGGYREVPFREEGGSRYAHFLNTFKAERLLDPHTPLTPTLIARRFDEDRQIPEKQAEELLNSVLASPLTQRVGRLIEKRLGRQLRPFDIWYDGFKARGARSPEELDAVVRSRYPSVEAFQADIPGILMKLGFEEDKANFLQRQIAVEASRGAGHAMGARMAADRAHLRTRVPNGMNYKGYNIAIHELGHTVEQVFSLNRMDHYFLAGVPNTAFTEAFAFVFQSRDLDLLGLAGEDPNREHLKALDTFWSTFEIGGVALVDMRVWRWMYDHPESTPADLQEAVASIATEIWNRYYAPVFGVADVPLLGIYSHMIDSAMYLPDYPIGHIIMFQIESYLKGKNLGAEMERMCRLGYLTPSLWMTEAVGTDISTAPLLESVQSALSALERE
jgi:hypothetical protein